MLNETPPGRGWSPHLPHFDPVPLRRRRDGWTPERQRALIAALAATRSVLAACAAVGVSRESAYRLYGRPDAASFRRAWDAALAFKAAAPQPPAREEAPGEPHRPGGEAPTGAIFPPRSRRHRSPLGNLQLHQECELPPAPTPPRRSLPPPARPR